MHRIMTLMVVVHCAERLYPPEELDHCIDYIDAVKTIRMLVDEICSGVPYILYSSRLTKDNAAELLFNAAHLTPTDIDGSLGEAQDMDENRHESVLSNYSDTHTSVPISGFEDNDQSTDNKGYAWIGLGGLPLDDCLYASSTLFCIPKEQRLWLRGRLHTIAKSYNLDHASALEKMGEDAEVKNKLDEEVRVGRAPTITDLAPLPWVEWRYELAEWRGE